MTTGPNCQDHCDHSAGDAGRGGGGGGGGGAGTLLDIVIGRPCLSDASLHMKSATQCSSSLMISKELTDGSSSSSSAVHTASSDSDPAFHWPGHEAIIESYYRYVEERSMERQLLTEQNHRLHHLNKDLIQKSEQLRNHMTGLLQAKEALAGNRLRLQSTIDDLKVCLKSLH